MHAGAGEEDEESTPLLAGSLGIHQLIHRIRFDLLTLIDTPLSTEQLTSPAITFSITRPLESTYLSLTNQAIIFALLVNRVQFSTDASHALTLHSVNATRASLCEILATNILRRLHQADLLKHKHNTTTSQKLTPEEEQACLLNSANVLATAFSPFEGAPAQVIAALQADWGASDSKNLLARQSNALEMAIVSEAKQFIRSPACQRVIDAIWSGKIVYTSTAIVDILSDRYKHRPVSLYNPRNAPLLNHYRLTVPRNRAALEYFHYAVLIGSYVATLQTRQLDRMNPIEVWFNVFTLGFAADKLGSVLEHGWLVFIANLWNGFDAAFILGHAVYLALRITGLVYLSHYELDSHWLNEQSHQVLSCLAILIFPRLAFITLSDNILILSLRSMLSDFVFLMLLGAWCFLGFGYALYSLQRGKLEFDGQAPYSLGEIAIWMVYIFFGLDATGISNAHHFHRILGPGIFIIYACLSNTLLVTVLVSILSKIFSDISNDSIAETLYRKAVLTFEGVKSDALFSFQPPFNIPAMLILIPLKPFLTPRKFHTVVVFLCRMFGCPVLLTISFFERYVVGPFDKDRNSLKLTVANSLGGLALNHFNAIINKGNNHPVPIGASAPRRRTTMSKMSSRITRNLRKFGGLAVINACFDYEPYPPVQTEAEAQENEDHLALLRDNNNNKKLSREPEQLGNNDTVRKHSKDKKKETGGPQACAFDKPSELENGTLRSPSTVRLDPASPLGPPAGRELTTLEKLFLPHAGIVSTFVGPVPSSDRPVLTLPDSTVERAHSPRFSSSSSSCSSSTIDKPPVQPRPAPLPSSSSSSRPATIYLDPPRTSLGGNHKPASIIQDELEEDTLGHRRRRRRTRRVRTTASRLSLARSPSSSEYDDEDDGEQALLLGLDPGPSRPADHNVRMVPIDQVDRLLQARLAQLEAKLTSSFQALLDKLPPPPAHPSSSSTGPGDPAALLPPPAPPP
ncbi:hypothetical protein PTTG_08032 [Puccinia triticina 1-1 BBBD Race 1]|uniref:Ion transport domain-containing protein n=2 Tax=Puccinia triticina TaxID=208348 RepID=A0A0C4F4J2_PUCT1|nr:uncharacterized protein PtA15_9A678 [Puccinia triticina]OAV97381.1 hypothetical protein PTTG_08032 [Puccinia triticina 1-1 BBBD Race 1]WAQ88551.1 hypothetical protein PtA15_9A678 [Puccinia triticina]